MHDKLKSFSSKIIIIKQFIDNTTKYLVNCSKKAGTLVIDSVEKYKLIRRLILAFIMYLCYDIHILTKNMYIETGQVDMQWVIYATAYTAMLTLFITFYTTNRVKEIDNEQKRALQEKWIDKNNNGINDCEEDWYIKGEPMPVEEQQFEKEIDDEIKHIS